MYVDESGDCGLVNSPTKHFILAGLIIHELRWQSCLDQLIDFRRRVRNQFGLKLREEIHAADFVHHSGSLSRISRHDRLTIIRAFAKELARMTDLNLIAVAVNKDGKPPTSDLFERAWSALIQRFENTLSHRNFTGPANPDERGTVFCDHTDDKKLVGLMRKMRRWNPIPNQPTYGPGIRNVPLTMIIEDPSFRDSDHSYFIQACDLAAYLLKQKLQPNSYMKSKSGHRYFDILAPILCRAASPRDPEGIVRL